MELLKLRFILDNSIFFISFLTLLSAESLYIVYVFVLIQYTDNQILANYKIKNSVSIVIF